jgi:hypothetical protein
MDGDQENQLNQSAYRQLQGFIARTYPPGRFVAISGGRIVADAETFEELDATLHHMGFHTPDVLVVQAGVEYPETAVLFSPGISS